MPDRTRRKAERGNEDIEPRVTYREYFDESVHNQPIRRKEFMALFTLARELERQRRWDRRAWRWLKSLFRPRVIVVQAAPIADTPHNGTGAEQAAEPGLILRP